MAAYTPTLGGGGGSRFKNHHYSQKTQMAEYLNPVQGHRGAMEKKGVQPKDHLRENKQALKELQSALRHRKESEAAAPPAMWKMQKFSKVPSKVALAIRTPSKSSLPAAQYESDETPGSPPQREFLRKGTLNRRVSEKAVEAHRQRVTSPRPEEAYLNSRGSTSSIGGAGSPYTSPRGSIGASSYSVEGLTPRKPAVPKANDLAKLAPKSNKNHIVENRRTAIHAHPPTRYEEAGPNFHKSFGQVPQYLQERKHEWAEEEQRRRAAQPDPNCPPGMRLLTDEERQETLHALAESEAEIRRTLTRMPLQVDTPSMIRRREELERRLGEIAKDKLLFTKPKVFIKADD